MTLTHILVFGAVALIVGFATRNRNRLHPLLAISALAIYALQPALPVRGLDFWLPSASLALACASTAWASKPQVAWMCGSQRSTCATTACATSSGEKRPAR